MPYLHDGQQFQCLSGTYSYETRHDSVSSNQWTTYPATSEASSPSSGDDGWEAFCGTEYEAGRRIVEDPDYTRQLELISGASQILAPATHTTASLAAMQMQMQMQIPPGLTNLRPSRHFSITPFEARLDNRINRLWGNYTTFARASSKGLGVTPLFGRTLSELFRQSRQMAENVRVCGPPPAVHRIALTVSPQGNELVADVRMCCGAADACMNTKLPAATRAQYLAAYQVYDARANVKYRQAVDEFARSIARDESPDVLPLYTATFLYYAAGVSCLPTYLPTAQPAPDLCL